MRITGKRSVSSFLGVALTVAWYFIFVAFGVVLAAMVGVALSPQAPTGHLTVQSVFLRITFSGAQVGGSRLVLLGTLFLVLTGLAIAQVIVYHLRKIIAGIQGGKPFSPQNSRHIRAIGITAIAGSVLNALVCFLVGYLTTNAVSIPGVDLSPRPGSPVGGILLGLVILVLAEVFRHGAELQEDHDLTV